jgi:hypothetical protein
LAEKRHLHLPIPFYWQNQTMIGKTKILVVDPDIDSLSKIYLKLLHRNLPWSMQLPNEIDQRLKRLKPSIVIIHHELYWEIEKKLKMPVIVLYDQQSSISIREQADLKILRKPVPAAELLIAVKSLTV